MSSGGLGIEGLRIVVTRPRHQADGLSDALAALGAIPLDLPTIEIQPMPSPTKVDAGIDAAEDADWVVFTSANGVRAVADRLAARKKKSWSPGRIAAIGPATAAALETMGLEAELVPEEFRAEAIAAAMGDVSGLSVVLLRAQAARPVLAEMLRNGGAEVLEVPVYRTGHVVPDDAQLAALRRGVDVVTFTSSSTVRGFVAGLGDRARSIADGALVASIGPITSATAQELGLEVGVEASEYTAEGLVRALVDHLENG